MPTTTSSTTMAERPSVFFRLEMGVSWPSKHPRIPKLHHLSYMSKSARERANQFPRQLPPNNTNYLAQTQQPEFANLPSDFDPAYGTTYPSQYQSYPAQQNVPAQPMVQPMAPPAQPMQQPVEQEDRRARSQSRASSQSRGRSAPPPLAGSPWDATVEPEPMMASALPRKAPQPQLWKALPPTPAQFRLGHDDMPWSSDPYIVSPSSQTSNESGVLGNSGSNSSGKTSAGPSRLPDDRERVRTKEMQSLATAMMTVDNGFEDQWWYQGTRFVNLQGDLVHPAQVADMYAPEGRASWPITNVDMPAGVPRENLTFDSNTYGSPASNAADIVSPVSDYGSPGSLPLRRTLTTRSDELFI